MEDCVQKRNPNARARKEAKAVGTNKEVASDVGLGAGASWPDTDTADTAINIATTTKKSFILSASISRFSRCLSIFPESWVREMRNWECNASAAGGLIICCCLTLESRSLRAVCPSCFSLSCQIVFKTKSIIQFQLIYFNFIRSKSTKSII